MAEAATNTSGSMGAPSTAPDAPRNAPSGSAGPTTHEVNPGAWMAGFSDDLKGKVGAKGFKSPVDLADSYFNLEKLLGAPKERLATLPEKFYDDQGVLTQEGRSIYERLGAPKEAKGYELEKLIPKENGDPKLMEKFTKVFHDLGVPKSIAEKIVTNWNEYQAQSLNTMREQVALKFKDSDTQLRKDWGAAYDQNRQIALAGKNRLGHDDKTVDALSQVLGHKETMKFYHQMGTAVGESTFVPGQPPSRGILEPSVAVQKINELKKDKEFATKLLNKDSQASELWTKLHQQAFPGETGLR